MALVLDTGPILALLDAADPDHQACVAMVEDVAEDLVVPATVLVEVDYWVLKLLGADTWAIFVEDMVNGAYRLEQVVEADLQRAAQLERAYADLDLGLVDASVIAVFELLGEPKVATPDRLDFSVVRPHHVETLRLLPGWIVKTD
jgi:predicted nucleic acid-binding protein